MTEREVTARRTWLALTFASVVSATSTIAVVVAWVTGSSETGQQAGGLLALGLAIAPFAFLVLAYGSKHPSPAAATVLAMLLSLVVAVLMLAIARDIVTGMVAGYASGATIALRFESARHSRVGRWIAVALVTLYVFVLLRTVQEAGIFAGPLLPMFAVGVADIFAERQRDRGT